MGKLSPPQQVAEISVRIIVAALQVMAIVGGALLIELTGRTITAEAVGGVAIAVGSLILIYEIIMIIFAITNLESVHHSARLLVDVVLKVVFAVLMILATLGVIVLAVILFVAIRSILESNTVGSLRIAIAIFAVPIGLGALMSIAFIVSAVTSGIISARLGMNDAVTTTQPSQVVVATPPQTVFMVPAQQQPAGYQPGYQPQGYSQPPEFKSGQYSDPQVGYTKPETIQMTALP